MQGTLAIKSLVLRSKARLFISTIHLSEGRTSPKQVTDLTAATLTGHTLSDMPYYILLLSTFLPTCLLG